MGNKDAPCRDCQERFTACSDKCPKDARGEYGYKAWLANYRKEQASEKEWRARNREAFLRSEECTWKNKRKGASK